MGPQTLDKVLESRKAPQQPQVAVLQHVFPILVAEVHGALERVERLVRAAKQRERAGKVVVDHGLIGAKADEAVVNFEALLEAAQAAERGAEFDERVQVLSALGFAAEGRDDELIAEPVERPLRSGVEFHGVSLPRSNGAGCQRVSCARRASRGTLLRRAVQG